MSVYFVFQGKTYNEEYVNGYVWAPKLTSIGRKNAGYENMRLLKKDDFIIHSCKGEIVAVSLTKEDCRESGQPNELITAQKDVTWGNEGYRVDCTYLPLDVPVSLASHRKWLAEHYAPDTAFNINGNGKQQYMSLLSDAQAIHLLESAIKLQPINSTSKVMLQSALNDIIGEDDYGFTDKEAINDIISHSSDSKPEWKGIKAKQLVITSPNTGREIPKRDQQVGADALARAEYKCEYNSEDRTFLRKNGKAYTEPHHLIPISKYKEFEYSLDVMENIVSLCSHCHNLLHYGRNEDKKIILKKLYEERKEALIRCGISISFDNLCKYYE